MKKILLGIGALATTVSFTAIAGDCGGSKTKVAATFTAAQPGSILKANTKTEIVDAPVIGVPAGDQAEAFKKEIEELKDVKTGDLVRFAFMYNDKNEVTVEAKLTKVEDKKVVVEITKMFVSDGDITGAGVVAFKTLAINYIRASVLISKMLTELNTAALISDRFSIVYNRIRTTPEDGQDVAVRTTRD